MMYFKEARMHERRGNYYAHRSDSIVPLCSSLGSTPAVCIVCVVTVVDQAA
jgi:hypothetical protein